MIRSMTGYGRGEKVFGTRTITLELRSVNNRYLDMNVKMPRAYLFAEDALKKRVQERVARGKVDIFVSVADSGGEAMTVIVNEELAKSYTRALQKLYEIDETGNVKQDYRTTELARFPDVLTVEKVQEDTEAVAAQLLETMDLALDDFNAMREKEGDRLAEDILGRAVTIEELTGKVEERSPQTVAEYRTKLENRMAEVLANTQIDQSRILTEAAIFADKVAVDEETVRLHSHLGQLRELLTVGGAVGRKLDFLIQEFNREANTIGSKCSDLEISRIVVDIKAEIEKIREQVQNIE